MGNPFDLSVPTNIKPTKTGSPEGVVDLHVNGIRAIVATLRLALTAEGTLDEFVQIVKNAFGGFELISDEAMIGSKESEGEGYKANRQHRLPGELGPFSPDYRAKANFRSTIPLISNDMIGRIYRADPVSIYNLINRLFGISPDLYRIFQLALFANVPRSVGEQSVSLDVGTSMYFGRAGFKHQDRSGAHEAPLSECHYEDPALSSQLYVRVLESIGEFLGLNPRPGKVNAEIYWGTQAFVFARGKGMGLKTVPFYFNGDGADRVVPYTALPDAQSITDFSARALLGGETRLSRSELIDATGILLGHQDYAGYRVVDGGRRLDVKDSPIARYVERANSLVERSGLRGKIVY